MQDVNRVRLPVVIGMAFVLAFIVPVGMSSIFFWQQTVRSQHSQEGYLAKTYSQNIQGLLDLHLSRYATTFENCIHGVWNRERLELTPLVYCGHRGPGNGPITSKFQKTAEDAFGSKSLAGSPWWVELRETDQTKIMFEAETGVRAAYYKKFILLYKKSKQGIDFALVDPLSLVSTLQTSIDEMSDLAALLPILTNQRGRILFSHKSIFYRAFFSDKSLSKTITENPDFALLDHQFALEAGGVPFQLYFVRNPSIENPVLKRFYTLLMYVVLLSVLLAVVGVSIVHRYITRPVVQLSKELNQQATQIEQGLASKDLVTVAPFTDDNRFSELWDLQRSLNLLIQSIRDRDDRLSELNGELRRSEVLAEIGKVSRQIAHDIRSPLTALRVSMGFLDKLPEQERLIVRSAVQRIEDIANVLGSSSKAPDSKKDSVYLLTSLIQPVVTEKRMQYRSLPQLNLDTDFGSEAYGLFARINPREFKRVLSNLIDNSVEACEGKEGGEVTVYASMQGKFCEMRVKDTGKGIPENIVSRITEPDFTHGKEGGTGLGLSHAHATVTSWGGKLTVHSSPEGTEISILIPLEPAPSWFVPQLALQDGNTICVLDDDVSIHKVWQQRFLRFGSNVSMVAFSDPAEVESYLKGSGPRGKIFLVDYELLGQDITGLDFVRKWNLEERSILVTSHYEEKQILDRCQSLGVRIIPKVLAELIPISLNHKEASSAAQTH